MIAIGLTTSVFLMNLGWVLLLANWAVEWTLPKLRRTKWDLLCHNKLLHAFLALVALHLLGLLWSDNWGYGLDDIRKKLPLLVVPLVVLTTPSLDRVNLHRVLFCYVGALFVASVVGLVRFFTIPHLPYREIIPFISHIRFSLNLCLAISLLALQVWKGTQRPVGSRRLLMQLLRGALMLYLLCYLLLLQSYTGIVVLFVLACVLLVVYWRRIAQRRWRIGILTILLLLLVAVTGISIYFVDDYYHLRPLSAQPLKARTVNGNLYTHECDGFVENGNYVRNYICDKELRAEWPKVSRIPIDSLTPNGYAVYPTLVRYLNAMGQPKDSAGVACLQPEDVQAIEKGIANPEYLKQLSLRRMYHVMLFEYESYRCYHVVCNFTMLQRFELWRNGLRVFADHPVVGTGTGDVVDECHAQLARDHSPMEDTQKHAHNQYITFLVTFGVLGFLFLLFVFVRGIVACRPSRSYVLGVVITITLVSFLTEDTLETLAGCMFVALFWSLFASSGGMLGDTDR